MAPAQPDAPPTARIRGGLRLKLQPGFAQKRISSGRNCRRRSRTATHCFAVRVRRGPNDLFFSFLCIRTRPRLATGNAGAADCGALRRRGQPAPERQMYSMINEVTGSGVVCVVLNPSYRNCDGAWLRSVSIFPERAAWRGCRRSDHGDGSSGCDAKLPGGVRINGNMPNTLGQLMQRGLLYKKYQTAKDNPELGTLLDQRICASGDRVVSGCRSAMIRLRH